MDTHEKLKALAERAQHWPPAVLAEVVDALLVMEDEYVLHGDPSNDLTSKDYLGLW